MCAHKKIQLGRELPFVNSSLRPIGACIQLKNQPHRWLLYNSVSPRLMNQLFMLFNNRFILPRRFCNLLDNIHNKLRVSFHPNSSKTMVQGTILAHRKDLLLKYTNKDEQTRRFETHVNCSFPHLKTIKILNFSRSVMPLVKYLLKHATVLEKFIIAARRKRSDVSPDNVKMEQELLSFPRSSSQ
ncbi:hypothetical protein H5410_043157, partial [Solanum commersonii]